MLFDTVPKRGAFLLKQSVFIKTFLLTDELLKNHFIRAFVFVVSAFKYAHMNLIVVFDRHKDFVFKDRGLEVLGNGIADKFKIVFFPAENMLFMQQTCPTDLVIGRDKPQIGMELKIGQAVVVQRVAPGKDVLPVVPDIELKKAVARTQCDQKNEIVVSVKIDVLLLHGCPFVFMRNIIDFLSVGRDVAVDLFGLRRCADDVCCGGQREHQQKKEQKEAIFHLGHLPIP